MTFKVLATPDTSPDLVSGMICGVVDLDSIGGPGGNVYTADSGNVLDGDTGTPIAMSGAEMVRIKPTDNPGVYCGSNGPDYTLFAGSVSLTPINASKVRRATPAPPPVARRLGRLATQ